MDIDSDGYHRCLPFLILDLHKSEVGPSNIYIIFFFFFFFFFFFPFFFFFKNLIFIQKIDVVLVLSLSMFIVHIQPPVTSDAYLV